MRKFCRKKMGCNDAKKSARNNEVRRREILVNKNVVVEEMVFLLAPSR